jgi:hypothetical protein
LRQPFGRRVTGGGDMKDLPAAMVQDDEAKEKPEADGGHDEQVDGGNAVGMIAQKSKSSL